MSTVARIRTRKAALNLPKDPVVWLEVIRRLIELGWLIWSGKEIALDRRGNAPAEAKRALKRYQRWAGLEPDGIPGPVTLHHLRQPRLWCGTPDALGAEQLCKWPQREVTWNIVHSLPGVSDADFKAAVQWGADQWNANCGVSLRYKTNGRTTTTNIRLTVANLGGPGNVLADQELPCGATANASLRGRYDRSELWHAGELPVPDGYIPLRLTGLHELGHALGLPHHAPGVVPAVMDPSLNTTLIRLQPWDIEQSQLRYGPPLSPGPPGGKGPWQITEQSENVLRLERQNLGTVTGRTG
jgi:hypothetical protein